MTDLRKTAVYIRLSAEDDNVDGRAKKESDSVTSQRILLKSFVIDQLGVAEADILEYVDDGVSGTHFKRQGFQQLQDDMRSGEIGCVVVKDFSRFGRDYLEVGFYIEYIFPLLQIRFISINDSYDSAASSGKNKFCRYYKGIEQIRRLPLVMSRNYQEGTRCSSRGLTRSKRNTGALRQ
ncbi:recombinase family protein [Blautia stercoris]